MGPIKDLPFERQAYLFAKLSGISYKNERRGRRRFKRLGFTSTFLNNGGNEAYILENDTDLVFVCRGTEVSKWSDIKEDLAAFMIHFEPADCNVHRGFYTAVQNLLPDFNDRIIRAKEKRIWCTGHSLGAAMVSLFAFIMYHDQTLPNPEGIFTFGCPRVGDWKFTQVMNATGIPNHRFVNNTDIVPRVPIWPYYHANKLYYMNHWGNIRDLTGWQLTKDIYRGFVRNLKHFRISFFHNHSIQGSYLPAVKRLALGVEAEQKKI